MNSFAIDSGASSVLAGKKPSKRLPPLFGSALGLVVVLPMLNFLRVQPIGDFFSEIAAVAALTTAVLAIAIWLPRRAKFNLTVIAIPGVIAVAALVQASIGMYAYSADWIFWVAYLSLAVLALLLGQVLTGEKLRHEAIGRIAWAVVLASVVNLLLQILQAARLDDDWRPYLVHLGGTSCYPFGNVGQANHANSLAWLGIVAGIYLHAVGRIGARTAAAVLAVLLLSSALTGARMGWLFLIATASLLAVRHVWPSLAGRSRVMLAAALIAGFVTASLGLAEVRGNMTSACVSSIYRVVDVNDSGNAIRLLLWKQALEVWQANPLLGVGAGGYIGAVYQMDLGVGHAPLDSWVHNTALQLLAEFGLIVLAAIVLVICSWSLRLVRHREELAAEDGFLLSGLLILGIHSMLEFPLWYAQFLILASLFIGMLIRPEWTRLHTSFPARGSLTLLAITLAVGSTVIVRDYLKLDRLAWVSEFIQGVGAERVPDAQVTLEEAAAQVLLFTQFRDYSLSMGRLLDKEKLEQKIAVVDRAMNRMPNVNLIHLRILLASLDNDPLTARSHMRKVFKFHPQHADALVGALRRRIEAHPEAFGILQPILEDELMRRPEMRW